MSKSSGHTRLQRNVFLRGLLSAVLFVSLFFWMSCEDSTGPFPPDTQPQLNQTVQKAATVSWRTLNSFSTSEDMFALVQGMDGVVTEEPGMLNSLPEIQQVERKASKVVAEALRAGAQHKANTDSLIWKQEWDDPVSGTAGERAFYYNTDTFEGRIYEVIYRFPASVRLRYDSTEVRLYLGPSLADTTDDRLLAIEKLSLFQPDFVVQSVSAEVEATHWDASNQVIGATAQNVVLYSDQVQLLQLQQNAQFNPDGSGSLSERLDYRDNTFQQSQVSFYPDYTGEFTEIWRNGVTVEGSFDLLEPDNHAAISQTITFPSHPGVNYIQQEAEYTLNPVDSSSTGIVVERIFFHNGNVDTTRVEAERYRDNGNWVEHLLVLTSGEGQSEILVTYFDSYKEFEGNHTTPEGQYIVFHGTEYQNGSGELFLELYESLAAYQNGDPPLLTLHIIYNGDGSGEGEIAYQNQKYQIKLSPGGEIEVFDPEGKRFALEGY